MLPFETTACGRSHFFRPTPGSAYPNPSPAVAAASSSTPIVCMELLQLPRAVPVGSGALRAEPTIGENAYHPDFPCDRIGHGRVEAFRAGIARWSTDLATCGQIGSTHPEPDHGSQVGPPRFAVQPSLRDALATLRSGTVCRTCVS